MFSNLANAAAELGRLLPAGLVAHIDWSTLELDRTSYVDEELQERFSDIVFKVDIRGRRAVIYILFEHQSDPDRYITFRLLRYMHLPDFRPVVEHLDRLSLQELRLLDLRPQVKVTLMLLARSRSSPNLFDDLAAFAEPLRAMATDVPGLATLISYILEVRDEPPHVTQAFFKQLLGKAGEEGFMTGAQHSPSRFDSRAKPRARRRQYCSCSTSAGSR